MFQMELNNKPKTMNKILNYVVINLLLAKNIHINDSECKTLTVPKLENCYIDGKNKTTLWKKCIVPSDIIDFAMLPAERLLIGYVMSPPGPGCSKVG